jgi:hypothetical protein
MVSVIKIALQVAILLGDEQRTYIRVFEFQERCPILAYILGF